MSLPRPSGTLRLQYHFDNQAQLVRHAHLLDGGRFAFFYPARLQPVVGAVAVLRATFADTDETLLMRGKVLSRTMSHAGMEGSWLEFPEKQTLRLLADRLLTARVARRYDAGVLVRVTTGDASSVARLLDVSANGARVDNGSVLAPDQVVRVALMLAREDVPTQIGAARVVWSRGRQAGLQFYRDDALTRRALARLVASLEQEWATALAMSHPPVCCRNGLVLQPTLPRFTADAATRSSLAAQST